MTPGKNIWQIGGDAGLEIRVPVTAGPHVVGVSFVREMWEPEGLPQAIAKRQVITNDQVYMDYANGGQSPNRRSLQEFWTGEGWKRLGHAEPSRDFRLSAQGCCRRAGVRFEDPFKNGPARLSPAIDERMCRRSLSFSTPAAGRRKF